MWLARSLLALVATVAACRGTPSDKVLPSDSTAPVLSNSAVEVTAPDKSYTLILPAGWSGVFRTDTLSTAERGTALPGALNLVYLPKDTSVIPQTLLVVAVYDSAAWVKVKRDGGAPPGDSVMSKTGRVFVLSLPQSNPFTPGSADALKFDSLAISPAQKASSIRVP